MAASSYSKHLWWMIGIPLVLIAGFVSWRVADMPEAIQGYFNGTHPIENPPRSMDTEEAADSDSTGTSTADGIDDFGACNAEAEVYCSGFYTTDWVTWAEENGYTSASWKLGLVDCLGQNEDQLSEACLDSLDRRQALNEALNTTCASDRAQYCRGVVPSPGSEPQVDCLKEHYDQLSEACAEALDAHEDAKPLEE